MKFLQLLVASSVQDGASSTMLTMVLSEARGLLLFLVIRGGIACNVGLGAEARGADLID